MAKDVNVFTAVVKEEGMVRRVVLEEQADGSYEVVHEPTGSFRGCEGGLAVGRSVSIPGEYL